MPTILEQLAWPIRIWVSNEYDKFRNNQYEPRRLYIVILVIILIPIITSYIFLQTQLIQQQENQNSSNNNNSFGFIGYIIWNSTTVGVASFVVSVWHFILRIVGITLGIGLGLGFAGHVYDALSDAQDNSNVVSGGMGVASKQIATTTSAPTLPKDTSKQITAMEDVNSYHSLMRQAGYSVDNGTLRAQMVRGEQAIAVMHANYAKRELKRNQLEQSLNPTSDLQPNNSQYPRVSLYKFDKGKTASMRMKCMWPNLSSVINDSLAKLTEFVLRDYVSSWYSKVDEHVVYSDPEAGQQRQELTSTNSSSNHSLNSNSNNDAGNRPSTALESEIFRRAKSNPSEWNSSTKQQQQELFRNNDNFHSFTEGVDGSGASISSSTTQNRPHTASNLATETATATAASLHSSSFSSFTDQQTIPSLESSSNNNNNNNNNTQQQRAQQKQQRTMALTTTGLQSSPFIDSLYSSFAYLLGMLATRASENVNVLELLLLHFPHIVGQSLRVYREMKNLALEKKRRRVATEREKLLRNKNNFSSSSSAASSSSLHQQQQQQQEGNVSEIAIVREYLLAGRFHRAVTFGIDVPSLLFADPLAKDCPPGPSYKGNSDCDRLNGHPDEDAILRDRMLSSESSLIEESELDYCRVLASKIAKMSVPKTEVDSSIVRTMLVEMLSSCVLSPIMGCFCPDSVNGWIITGLGLLKETGETSSFAANDSVTGGMVRVNSLTSETNQSMMTDDPNRNCPIPDGVMEDIVSVGSIASEMDDSVFGIDDDESTKKADVFDIFNCSQSEQIITLLSMSIIELSIIVDFEDCRYAREHNQDHNVDWDSEQCRNSVKHLVLVIEAALLFGVRTHPKRQYSSEDRAFSEFEIEATLEEPDEDEFEIDIDEGPVESRISSSVQQNHASLSAALMELTGDIDAFERLVENAEVDGEGDSEDENEVEVSIPNPNELATLRTLIAAWLHTGQTSRVISIVVRARQTILRRFYHRNAFLRKNNYADDFTRLLRQLDGVDILVDTMAVLASQCLLQDNGLVVLMKLFQRQQPKTTQQLQQGDPFAAEMMGRRRQQARSNATSMSVVGSVKANLAQNRERIARFAQSAAEIDLNPFKDKQRTTAGASVAYNLHQSSNSTPAYLEYSKNEVFASSLRTERERRSASWRQVTKDQKNLEFVSRTKGVKDKDVMMHRELHHLSRFFYTNCNEIRIEPCSSSGDEKQPSSDSANVIVKAVGPRRKIEVPDEDSSFLLRAQVRPLKPVAIQRDPQNPDVACKIYVAMYEEPSKYLYHPYVRSKRLFGY